MGYGHTIPTHPAAMCSRALSPIRNMLTTLDPCCVRAQRGMKLLMTQDPTPSNQSSCIVRCFLRSSHAQDTEDGQGVWLPQAVFCLTFLKFGLIFLLPPPVLPIFCCSCLFFAFHLVNYARLSPSTHCGLRPTGEC